MKPREAKQLIVDEATAERGIVVLIRMGEDPGPERMRRLVLAIRVLFDRISDLDKLHRDAAAALYALATHVPANVVSWQRNGKKWRSELTDIEMPNLVLAVESVFENEWMADDSLEGEPA